MEFRHVYSALGTWPEAGKPLYQCLAAALERAIRSETLPAGTQLPAERQMAKSLFLSRGTVEAAYDDLRSKGLVATKRGSGTIVAEGTARSAGRREARVAAATGGPTPIGGLVEYHDERDIDFRTALWLGSEGDLPAEAFALAADDLRRHLTSHGYHPAGIPELREALAAHLSADGLTTEPDEVLVTSGSQQALFLISELVLEENDRVLVESITNARGVATFEARGARIVHVPTGPAGVDVKEFVSIVQRRAPRLAHIMPGTHDTTGSVLPAPSARQLAHSVAELASVLVIDDRSLAPLWFNAPPPPPLSAYEPESPHIVTVGSLSRWTWTGLRIGWIRAPKPMISRLARLKAHEDVGCSVADQLIALRLLACADAILHARRAEVRCRYEFVAERLHAQLPEWTWDPPAGGYSLWITLPDASSGELAIIAQAHHALLLPGSALTPSGGGEQSFRLPFGLPRADLDAGITRLAAAWKDLAAQTRLHARPKPVSASNATSP